MLQNLIRYKYNKTRCISSNPLPLTPLTPLNNQVCELYVQDVATDREYSDNIVPSEYLTVLAE